MVTSAVWLACTRCRVDGWLPARPGARARRCGRRTPRHAHRQVDRAHVLGQLAAADAVHPGARDVADAVQVDPARHFQQRAAGVQRRRVHVVQRKVVQQHAGGAGVQRLVAVRPGSRPRSGCSRRRSAPARPAARRVMPPAAAMWFSLIRMPSHSAMRWLLPPPVRTAYFCAWRRPGRVLRVSSTTQPAGWATGRRWRRRRTRGGGHADSICRKFSAGRSA
jgi:hypothetical protein